MLIIDSGGRDIGPRSRPSGVPAEYAQRLNLQVFHGMKAAVSTTALMALTCPDSLWLGRPCWALRINGNAGVE